jgi:hypothetical protein
MTEFSELFLVDAESRNADLQRFAAGARGATLASAASAADELADLLRSFGLAPHAGCARALARALPKAAAAVGNDPGEWRRLVTALAAEVADLTDRLRRQTAIADPARFVDHWLAQLAQLVRPTSPDAAAPAAAAALLSAVVGETAAAPLATPLAPDTRSAHAEAAEAQRRHTALQQARLLHESLPQTPGPSRAAVERVIADLVAQARSSVSVLAGWPLSSPLSAAPEALQSLASVIATLPRPRALQAWAAASELGLDLDGLDPASPSAQAAARALAELGGCAQALPDGLRLRLPRDPCQPSVVLWRGAQGWFAVPALQADARHRAADPASPPEAAACLWRYELPASDAWSRPPDWQALVCDASGRVMPLLGVTDPAGPRSEAAP